MLSNKEATAMRSPCTATREYPRSPQLMKSPHSKEDPAQPQINKQKFNKELKEGIRTVFYQIENISKREIIKITKQKFWSWKFCIITKIKNSLEKTQYQIWTGRRMNQWLSEDKSVEIIQCEKQNKKRMKRGPQNLRALWITLKQSDIHIMRWRERNRLKKYLEK